MKLTNAPQSFKMFKIMVLLGLIIMCFTTISAYSVTTFNNSLSNEVLNNTNINVNLNKINITRYVTLNNTQNLTVGRLNLSELFTSSFDYVSFNLPTRINTFTTSDTYTSGAYFNGTHIFSTNVVGKLIRVYALDGTLLTTINLPSTAGSPSGIWSNGTDFWVTDYGIRNVTHYNSSGALIYSFNVSKWSDGTITGITSNITNGVPTDFWIASYGSAEDGKIAHVNRTGALISNFSTKDKVGASYDEPTGITYDSYTGDFWIIDDVTNTALRINESGYIFESRSVVVNAMQQLHTNGIDFFLSSISAQKGITRFPNARIPNLTVYINDTPVYFLNTYPNRTIVNNLTNEINNYLARCSEPLCDVPIKFNIGGGYQRFLNVSEIYLSNEYLINSYNYSNAVLEFSNNLFNINITYDSSYYTSLNVFLNYNNTDYFMTTSDTGNTKLFSKSINAPSVDQNTNISFYYKIVFNNGTSTVTETTQQYNQTVLDFKAGACNTTNTVKILNFTLWSESTRQQLFNNSYNLSYAIDLKIGDWGLNNYIRYNANATTNSFAVCINSTMNQTLRMDYLIQYSASTFTTEEMNVQNFTLNSSYLNQNISLYPLLSSVSQEFLIKAKSSTYLPLKDAVIEIYRYYPELSSPVLVEAPLTDSLGQTVGHFVKNDVIYNIVVKRYNVTLYSYENVKVYCNTLTTECILNLNQNAQTVQPDTIQDLRGVTYTATYDDDTRIYSVSFASTNSSSKTIAIYGFRLTNVQNETLCSNSLTAVSGIVTCDLSSVAEQTTVLINTYVNGQLLFSDYVEIGYKKSDTLDNIRYVLMAFMLPLFVGLGLSSGVMAVMFFFIGIIFGLGIFLLDKQSYIGAGAFLVWFVIAGLVLIVKIMKGGVKNG